MTEDGTAEGQVQRRRRAANTAPMQPPRVAAKNSDMVYGDLRRGIVDMEFPPNTPILERELTQRYGISRTPVREAVLRLAEEGLVTIVPKSGTFVSRIPLTDLREAVVARRALEEVTVRAATGLATGSQIMELRAIIERQAETAAAGQEAAFHRADEDFHAAIATAGRYPGLWQMILQIRVQLERYRRLTLPQPGRMKLVVEEHTAVVDAIARRDANRAVARMNDHLGKLQLDIAVFRDLWPDYFIYDPEIDQDLLAG